MIKAETMCGSGFSSWDVASGDNIRNKDRISSTEKLREMSTSQGMLEVNMSNQKSDIENKILLSRKGGQLKYFKGKDPSTLYINHLLDGVK